MYVNVWGIDLKCQRRGFNHFGKQTHDDDVSFSLTFSCLHFCKSNAIDEIFAFMSKRKRQITSKAKKPKLTLVANFNQSQGEHQLKI